MMIQSGDKQIGEPSSPPAKSISVHRAFVYSASAPGLGEFYAGCRLRGLATAALFICATVWFTRTLFVIISGIMGRIFDSFSGAAPFVLPEVPFLSIGISFFAFYFIWLWAMISAVDAATEHRQRNGGPPQANVGWAVAISWFCPGSGQVYTGSRRYGYLLFAAYLLAILAVVPAYMQLFDDISRLAGSGELSPNNPYTVINIVHKLVARAEHSFGKLLQASVKYFAIAGTIGALRQRLPETDTRWSRPSAGYGAALVGIGWLCPGAGQLLQKRDTLGGYILAGYIGSTFLVGFLLHLNFITVATADLLDWLPIAIKWGSMAEALFLMIKKGKGNKKQEAHSQVDL
jgi:TM2 domain-containing membrane protein YozV